MGSFVSRPAGLDPGSDSHLDYLGFSCCLLVPAFHVWVNISTPPERTWQPWGGYMPVSIYTVCIKKLKPSSILHILTIYIYTLFPGDNAELMLNIQRMIWHVCLEWWRTLQSLTDLSSDKVSMIRPRTRRIHSDVITRLRCSLEMTFLNIIYMLECSRSKWWNYIDVSTTLHRNRKNMY